MHARKGSIILTRRHQHGTLKHVNLGHIFGSSNRRTGEPALSQHLAFPQPARALFELATILGSALG
jgi:hypothetical protein